MPSLHRWSSHFYLPNKATVVTLFVLLSGIILSINFVGCVSGRGSVRSENRSAITLTAKPGSVLYGVASYYGEEFAGRATTSGEIFSPFALTAAHQSLPMGTSIRVTNMKNNKSVVVRVNDRMPYHPDRILDLSKAAAKEIGMIGDGLAKVKIEILSTE